MSCLFNYPGIFNFNSLDYHVQPSQQSSGGRALALKPPQWLWVPVLLKAVAVWFCFCKHCVSSLVLRLFEVGKCSGSLTRVCVDLWVECWHS